MTRFFKRIGNHISDILYLDIVGKKYSMLALNYVFIMIYSTIEGTFVNTLLYRISPSMSIVILYRAVVYSVCAIGMQFAAYIAQKRTPITVIKLGAVFFLCMYLTLFFGMDYMPRIYLLAAVLNGLGGAFYWSAHGIFVANYTTASTRDIGISLLGIIQGVFTLICPVVSGFVIKLMPGNTGYRIMFGIGMLAVIAQIIVHSKFYPIEQTSHKSQVKLAFKVLREKLSCRFMMLYNFLKGLRDGTFIFIVNMLLFQIVTDESLIGINTFLTGLMAITGSWAYGKLVKVDNRVKFSFLSTTSLIVVCFCLILKTTAVTMMIYTVLNAFLQLFLLYAIANTDFDVISQDADTRLCMGELLAFKEIALGSGRVVGLIFVSFFASGQRGYLIAMLILTITQYAVCALLKVAINFMKKDKKTETEPA